MIYKFKEAHPIIDPSAYVHPQATVIGSVKIGKDVFIGAHAVLRGDFGSIIIEDGCNVQENCTIHMFPGTTVHLHQNAHIGHGAIIHGATIGKNVLVGMNAVIMDDVNIGENSIVGALAFLPANMDIPARSLLVGNPAKIIRYKFPPEIIEMIAPVYLNDLPSTFIKENINLLYQPLLTTEDALKLVEKIKHYQSQNG